MPVQGAVNPLALGVSFRQGLPVLVSQSADTAELARFRAGHQYIALSEPQFYHAAASVMNTEVRVQRYTRDRLFDAVRLRIGRPPRLHHTLRIGKSFYLEIPLYNPVYDSAMGIRVDFADESAYLGTDAPVRWHSPDGGYMTLSGGYLRGWRMWAQTTPREESFHLTALNLPAHINVTDRVISIDFIGGPGSLGEAFPAGDAMTHALLRHLEYGLQEMYLFSRHAFTVDGDGFQTERVGEHMYRVYKYGPAGQVVISR
jgi:hypothetical protein